MEVVSRYHASQKEMEQEYELVKAAKEDPAAFRPLYDRYYERIFLFIYQRMDDKDIAHDAVSQVFLKALTNLHKYEFKGVPFASWLYRIAKSEVYQIFRQQQTQRTVNIERSGLGEMMEEMEDDPYAPYAALLGEAVAELEEDDLQLIEMRFFEKRPFKEIGDILDITENNAKVKVYRILERLRKNLLAKKKTA
ncbi:MAG: RNA polymerase sigma-70 factor, ECF subfamily [Bacteroidetes bacterium]|nr:MAG: RNA polymerase sigma-70 factor, ECF subfamily [Bacteroidota bacterium]